MNDRNFMPLQRFAQGEAAGNTGEGAADAGQEALQPDTGAESTHRAQEKTGQDAAAPRLSWDQIKSDPEYSQRIQELIRSRLKNVKQAQQDLETLTPALQVLARQHGLDPQRMDYSALAQAVRNAGQPGIGGSEEQLRSHFRDLEEQARQLQRRYPDFDLQAELRDPTFLRLTAPGVGVSLEDAFYTVHRRQLQAAAVETTARRTAENISNAIRSGVHRPQENGTGGHAPAVTSFDYRNASRQQREELKRAIRSAGARGEKLYPGR